MEMKKVSINEDTWTQATTVATPFRVIANKGAVWYYIGNTMPADDSVRVLCALGRTLDNPSHACTMWVKAYDSNATEVTVVE